MGNIQEWMNRLAKHPDDFAAAIQGMEDTRLAKRPDEKNWAPKEIICHMRDTEELFFSRFQNILSIEEPRLPAADAERWAGERQYIRNDAQEALAAFRKRREETLQFLRGLTPAQLSRVGIHSKYGGTTLEAFVELMVKHGNDHLAQLARALSGQP
ncbi:MAG: DinB family protein [Deltaproteobacteria bacterium]|nr:DinB family protein [Deltaproteobacteria bacterium]